MDSVKEEVICFLKQSQEDLKKEVKAVSLVLMELGDPSRIRFLKRREINRLRKTEESFKKDLRNISVALKQIKEKDNFELAIDLLDLQIKRSQEIVKQYDRQASREMLLPFTNPVLAGGGGIFGPRAQAAVQVDRLKELKEQLKTVYA